MKENTGGRVKKSSRKSAFTYKLAGIVDALSYYVESWDIISAPVGCCGIIYFEKGSKKGH